MKKKKKKRKRKRKKIVDQDRVRKKKKVTKEILSVINKTEEKPLVRKKIRSTSKMMDEAIETKQKRSIEGIPVRFQIKRIVCKKEKLTQHTPICRLKSTLTLVLFDAKISFFFSKK